MVTRFLELIGFWPSMVLIFVFFILFIIDFGRLLDDMFKDLKDD